MNDFTRIHSNVPPMKEHFLSKDIFAWMYMSLKVGDPLYMTPELQQAHSYTPEQQAHSYTPEQQAHSYTPELQQAHSYMGYSSPCFARPPLQETTWLRRPLQNIPFCIIMTPSYKTTCLTRPLCSCKGVVIATSDYCTIKLSHQ